MSRLLQRQEIKHKVQLVTSRVYPLSTPTLPGETENEEWLIVLHHVARGERGRKQVGGLKELAAENAWPQPRPPPDLSPSPFCRAIKGKTIFSYCFIKHYVALFIAVSPDSYSIPAAAVCTAPDWTEKDHWSSIRWKMELSESVTPPPPTEQHCTQMCECVF